MKKFTYNQQGNAAIEFAIIIPLLLAFVFAVIEFGAYFVKDQITLNALASISGSLQQAPDPEASQIQQEAIGSGGTFLSYDVAPNYFCAKAYKTWQEADSGSCSGGWDTAEPAGAVGGTYYIRLEAKAAKLKIFFSDYLPDINRHSVVTIGAQVVIPDPVTVSAVCPAGQCGVQCPSGKKVVGGGTKLLATNGTCHVHSSYPSGNGWYGGNSPTNSSTTYCSAQVYAICM